MFLLDHLAEISSAVALIAAVVSPWVTAAINNRHQLKMERIRFNVVHRAEVIERFISCAGEAISDYSNIGRFGAALGEAYVYLPDHILNDVDALSNAIYEADAEKALSLLSDVCRALRDEGIRPSI